MKSLKYMISTLAVNKWKLCLHNIIKKIDGSYCRNQQFFDDMTEKGNVRSPMAFEEKLVPGTPENTSVRRTEANIMQNHRKPGNPDKHWLPAWQHLATSKIAPK